MSAVLWQRMFHPVEWLSSTDTNSNARSAAWPGEFDLQENYPSARDSYSFLPALFEPEIRIRRPTMVETPWSIRQDDWKLVCPRKHRPLETIEVNQFELYNLAEDPSETEDVAGAHPEVAASLFEQFQAFVRSRELK